MSLNFETTTIIKLYDNIKIIHVNAADNIIRKYETRSTKGYFEINLNEQTNKIHLVLYDKQSEPSFEKYFDIKLDEFNFSNLKSKPPVEFKTNRVFELTSYYAIDFSRENDYDDLTSTLNSLKEIYIDEKMDSLDDTDFFIVDENNENNNNNNNTNYLNHNNEKMDLTYEEDDDEIVFKKSATESITSIDEICHYLKEAIFNGNIENSIKYVTELANRKANLDICISKKRILSNKEKTNDDTNDDPSMNKINLIFKNKISKKYQFYLDGSVTSILDLKQKVIISNILNITYYFTNTNFI
jgi:hypothetical protein